MRTDRKAVTAAKIYLEMRGFTIMELYWHLGARNIDIIAKKNDRLWFVMVSSDKQVSVGTDHTYATISKQKALVEAASTWADTNKLSAAYTVATIEVDQKTRSILNFNEDFS